jgi:hypothetical protein
MPATLCEAVQATRDLGIRYLWIDALCILQSRYKGDVEAEADWQRESARMSDVYGGAYLTLVAAGSSDCEGGLFRGRPTCIVPYQVASSQELHQPPKYGVMSKLFRRLKPQNNLSAVESDNTHDRKMAILSLNLVDADRLYDWAWPDILPIHNEAITSRAWAFQEWLLSPRLLLFTTRGMRFMCDAGKIPVRHRSHQFRLPQSSANVKKSDWSDIVMTFASRNLSVPSDKLPAISGVAKSYARICGYALQENNYLAGLWRADLFNHLLWRNVFNEGHSVFQPVNHHHGRRMIDARPRAPSWSWAAIDGPVDYPDTVEISLATIIRCETRPEPGHDQFGRVESGILVLHCRFVLTSLMEKPPTERLRLHSESSPSFMFWPDDVEEVAALRDTIIGEPMLYCLLITRTRQWRSGIVVMQSGQTGYFVRLGYFVDESHGFEFDSAEREFEIR